MIEVQFEKILLQSVSHLGHIPLAIEVYERLMPVIEKALGIYYQSSYYVARRPNYKAETVFFERFSYDFISMLGVNLLFLESKQLELISRKVFTSVSYNFDFIVMKGDKPDPREGGLRLIALECVKSTFT
jgi:hypothetical protein